MFFDRIAVSWAEPQTMKEESDLGPFRTVLGARVCLFAGVIYSAHATGFKGSIGVSEGVSRLGGVHRG
jgi:hypothetical protein